MCLIDIPRNINEIFQNIDVKISFKAPLMNQKYELYNTPLIIGGVII